MVYNRERQPHYQLKLLVGYGLQLTLALVGGACLDLPKHECTRDLGLRRRARVSQADRPTFLPG
jgi:hypothetical protein